MGISRYVPASLIFDLYPKNELKKNKIESQGKEEPIEWLNFWIENADCYESKRWLLVGDSVFRQLREEIMLHTIYDVDLIASSSYGSFYEAELNMFFDNVNYKYESTLINVDHHGYMEDIEMDGLRSLAKITKTVNISKTGG